MSLLLNVPFAEKDTAKALGAKWNPDLKKWYVPSKKDYHKFSKWILGDNDEAEILCDYFYIITGTHKCFKCKQATHVIGFGIEKYFEFYDPKVYDTDSPCEYNSGEIHICSFIEGLPEKFYTYLEKNYNYFNSYSKTLSEYCFANHCSNCGIIQGNFFLFDEVDSPFFIDSAEKASALSLLKIDLPYDMSLPLNIGIGSEDYLIKKHASFQKSSLSLSDFM